MNAALIEIDIRVLRMALGMPNDAVIHRAFVDEYVDPQRIMLVVEHKDLPEHAEGNVLAKARPFFGKTEKPGWSFIAWGI